jgi:hypothetical protein
MKPSTGLASHENLRSALATPRRDQTGIGEEMRLDVTPSTNRGPVIAFGHQTGSKTDSNDEQDDASGTRIRRSTMLRGWDSNPQPTD